MVAGANLGTAIPNRTFLVSSGGISSLFGRSKGILVRGRLKIGTMALPNPSDTCQRVRLGIMDFRNALHEAKRERERRL